MIAADGGLKAWDGTTVTNGIAGFSQEAANNLAALGQTPQAYATPPQSLTFGKVPNEPSAQNIGQPLFNDGRVGLEVSDQDNVFRAQVGPSQTTALTDVGASYGLTIDTDNHWYVDKTKTGASAVVKVTKLDPIDTTRGVWFVVLPGAAQLVA